MTTKIGTSYFGNRILRHVAADMDQLVREGFTYVCHTYSENDMLFYHRTMKDIGRITREAGLEFYADPWGVGKVFGGEAFSNFIACNLDCLQVLSDGKPAGQACPMNPHFREFMIEWIEKALELGPDYIFWDEPHFSLSSWIGGRPGQWGCRCDVCKGHFHDRFGHEMPTQRTPEVNAYLEWGIRDFLAFVIGAVKERGGKNCLCLLPHDEGEEGAVTNWEEFAKIPGLDILSTDPYFELQKKPIGHVEKYGKVIHDLAAKYNIESELWYQGFRVDSGREHLQGEAIDIGAALGVSRMAVWGFDACDHMGWIRPDDPKKLWSVITERFQAARGV